MLQVNSGSISAVVLAAISIVASGCDPAAAPMELGAEVPVGGQVLLEDKPINNVNLMIGGPVEGSATTDKDGKFDKVKAEGYSGGLPPGEYMLTVDADAKWMKAGLTPEPIMFKVPEGGDKNLQIIFRKSSLGGPLPGPGGPGGPGGPVPPKP